MKLIFSHFDLKGKVKILYSIPNQNIPSGILDTLNETFKEYQEKSSNKNMFSYDLGPYLSYIFNIKSAWYSDVKEKLILTFYFEEHENTHFFKDIIKETIIKLKKIENLSKIIYINTPHADNETFKIHGSVIKILTECYFEASKLHSSYNLGLSEVLILGHKGSGKTSIVDYLIHGKFVPQKSPTLTPQVYKLIYNQVDFRVLDICCETHLKEIFQDHPIELGKLPQAIVYVVDATQDEKNMKRSSKEFNEWISFLSKKYPASFFEKIPFLVLFNKVDLNPQFKIIDHRELFTPEVKKLNLRYSTSSIINGTGVESNFNWLVKNIRVTESV